MGRSIDDIADIYGRNKRAAQDFTPSAGATVQTEVVSGADTIPDIDGAPTGLNGVKAPASPGQHGEILDRSKANGATRFVEQKLGLK